MKKTPQEILDSHEYGSLVSKKWSVSIILTVLLFINYYGYIFSIAYNKEAMIAKVGEVTTLGIPVAVGVILVSWVLVAVYIVWANKTYDPAVRSLRDQILSK